MDKKNIKNERIDIRLSEKEKKKIEKMAFNSGMKVSQYLLHCSKKNGKKVLSAVQCTAIMEEICNYIEEEYGADAYLEKVREELWNML